MKILNMSQDFNSTETDVNNTKNNDGQIDILVLFGPTNPYFDMIHYTALVSLGISIIISMYTLMYLVRKGNGSLSRWKMGERLVLYLAVADLLFSISHAIDHLYSVLQIKYGFEEFCIFAAFLLETFSNAQSILVVITAISAFVTVAFNKRITFGKYDWLLLLATIGIPATVSSVMAALDWLGPSGFWWLGDLRKTTGPLVYTIFSSFIIATFIANVLCYFGVWTVIMTTAKQINRFKEDDDDSRKYRKTAKILVLFVIAYMAQWWPLVVYTVWSYIAVPHIGIIEVVVIFANMGGLFNYVAYTFVRKQSNDDKLKRKRDGNEMSTSNTTLSTVSN